jgi:hypothetical protein
VRAPATCSTLWLFNIEAVQRLGVGPILKILHLVKESSALAPAAAAAALSRGEFLRLTEKGLMKWPAAMFLHINSTRAIISGIPLCMN